MAYLYGDSSPSPLTGNFLEFLRDALDFSVHLVLATQRLEAQQESADAHEQAAGVELRRLDALEELVRHALAGAAVGLADSPTARCAAAIEQGAAERVARERDAVREKLAREIGRIESEVARERDGCARAFEALVKKHDLPQVTSAVTLRVLEGGRYEALLHQATPYGLDAVVELEVPAQHALGHVLRLDRLVERLEVSAPDLAGWLQKKVKLRPQRLERYYLIGLAVRSGETVIRLRAQASGEGDGYDVTVAGPPARVRLVRLGEQGETVGEPLDYPEGDSDAAKLVDLRDRLAALGAELTAAGHRRALREAGFAGEALREVQPPSRVVERLVAAMAPVVHEIARHSLSPNELVIKRLLGDDRREEVFVTRKELRGKIDQVPESVRGLFDPLGLGDLPTLRPPARRPEAPPAASTVAAPPSPPRRVSTPSSPVIESVPEISSRALESVPTVGTKPDAEVELLEVSAPAIQLDEQSLEPVAVNAQGREDSVQLEMEPEAPGAERDDVEAAPEEGDPARPPRP